MAGDLRGQLFAALTGHQGADVSGGGADGNLRGMLLAAYGGSRRDSTKPDTSAAAKGLGVSQRTVQRWLADRSRQHQAPKPATLARLTTKARQAATTKRGRAQALKRTLLSRGAPPGMRVTVAGQQGPERQYARFRTVNFDLDDPGLAGAFAGAYVDGGAEGAMKWLRDNADQTYGMDQWHFGAIDTVSITGPYGRS